MQYSIHIQPIPHRAPDPSLDLEQPVRPDNKVCLVADLDAHLAGSNRAQPHPVRVRIELQHGTSGHGVDAEGDVVTEGDGVGGGGGSGGEVRFGEGDC